MLIYVEGKNFSGQTFVLTCDNQSKVSRVKALLLHMLHDVGLSDHYFRLMFENQFLKEPLTLSHYKISEMSVLQMVPVSFGRCVRAQTAGGVPRPSTTLARHTPHPSHNSHLTPVTQQHNNQSVGSGTVEVLRKEVKIFKQREVLLNLLKVMLLILTLLAFVDFGSSYWWAGIVSGFVAVLSILFLPHFAHLSGTMGTMRTWDKRKMVALVLLHLILALFYLGLFLYLLSADLLQNDCYPGSGLTVFHDPTLALGCSYHVWLSLVVYPLQTLLFTAVSLAALGVRINFNFQAGLLVEPTLSKAKPISELLEIAQQGRARDKRQVAFELGNIALLGEDSKREIVAAGGLQVLISLISEEDGVTQEYAIEALAELLSLQSIQKDFTIQGGVAILCALLCSPNQFVMEQAAIAVSFVTSHCSNSRVATVQENGINALAKALYQGPPHIVLLVMKSVLNLAYCPVTLPELCSDDAVVEGLLTVVGGTSHKEESRVMALLALDKIGALQPSVISGKVELIKHILDSLASLSHDIQALLSAVRLLMIFAKDINVSKHLLKDDSLLKLLNKILLSESCHVYYPGLQLQVVQLVEMMMQQKQLLAVLVCQGVRGFLERLKKRGVADIAINQTVLNCLEMLD